MCYFLLSFYLGGIYNDAREEFIEALRKQKVLSEMHNELNTTKIVVTQKRFLELQANDRLGLRNAKEEEVLVSK